VTQITALGRSLAPMAPKHHYAVPVERRSARHPRGWADGPRPRGRDTASRRCRAHDGRLRHGRPRRARASCPRHRLRLHGAAAIASGHVASTAVCESAGLVPPRCPWHADRTPAGLVGCGVFAPHLSFRWLSDPETVDAWGAPTVSSYAASRWFFRCGTNSLAVHARRLHAQPPGCGERRDVDVSVVSRAFGRRCATRDTVERHRTRCSIVRPARPQVPHPRVGACGSFS